jgi:hypothetical protein
MRRKNTLKRRKNTLKRRKNTLKRRKNTLKRRKNTLKRRRKIRSKKMKKKIGGQPKTWTESDDVEVLLKKIEENVGSIKFFRSDVGELAARRRAAREIPLLETENRNIHERILEILSAQAQAPAPALAPALAPAPPPPPPMNIYLNGVAQAAPNVSTELVSTELASEFKGLGGQYVELPPEITHAASNAPNGVDGMTPDFLRANIDENGAKTFQFIIEPTDYLIPVCHQGMNRSQVLRRVLLNLVKSNQMDSDMWVSRPHGASSGCDAYTAYRDVDDSNYFGYLFDYGKIFAEDYNLDEDRDDQQGPLNRGFEAAFKTNKSPRLGEEMAKQNWPNLNPQGDPPRIDGVAQDRSHSHNWFNNHVFGPISKIQERLNNYHFIDQKTFAGLDIPTQAKRRIFICFARAPKIVIDRLIEARGAENTIVIGMDLDDTMNNALRICEESGLPLHEAGCTTFLKGIHKGTYNLYESLFHMTAGSAVYRAPQALAPPALNQPVRETGAGYHYDWIKSGVKAAVYGRIGIIAYLPDSEGCVQLRWADDHRPSTYIHVSHLTQVTEEEAERMETTRREAIAAQQPVRETGVSLSQGETGHFDCCGI